MIVPLLLSLKESLLFLLSILWPPNVEGFPPCPTHTPSNSVTPAGCPTVQFSLILTLPVVSDPTGQGLSPTGLLPTCTSDAKPVTNPGYYLGFRQAGCKSEVPMALCSNLAAC